MAKSAPKRIQETRTLYDILPPKSAHSGREFARIVNLLLFHDGRRKGRTITLFDDRAGDYHGLDAFERQGRKITVGYQHKFYPSPLTDKHREDIEKSLRKTVVGLEEAKIDIERWVLVTPEDPVESGTRRTGGDVTWFEGLRKKHKLPFEIEHWAHAQLQALFLETPSIGLYYYPELFPEGVARRRTIQELRAQYDAPLLKEHGHIEFVGMSVYKEEAARSVPMENIYIPLSVISHDADEKDPDVPRRNPLELLAPGTCHLVLGDPGSGKTTLLRFLALFGQSKALQQRYGQREEATRFHFERDERLPVLVTLRRYADALKANDNLSLADYIRENIAADFSIADVSTEFLEYYLESGRTILLFDGLDELPNPAFKQKVRNRIRNLTATYPGNTTVVSSRIYGYEGAFRFDEKEFAHHRLARLRMEEIEQFVRDWYQARLEKPPDRKEYLESLLGILRNEEHEAIRELARNPLLLTIMVLVHRIDAVLPDERHVLYQKCTETLLNTWHTWKFHEMDRLRRAKVDRQNMQRMQAIAYWMHHQMGGAEAGQQAVVSYDALHRCLTEHVATETPPNPDYAPEDVATAFIEFVQDRAGLLVEIGDRQFSFVHLTFQEYLTAAHIRTLSELNGVREAWGEEIENHCPDPRWREVIRLLVAGYGSNASQDFLMDCILGLDRADPTNAQLLGGLLLDGVAAAEMKKSEVFARLLLASSRTEDEEELRNTLALLRACREKADGDWDTFKAELHSLARSEGGEEGRTRLRLTALATGMTLADTWEQCGRGPEREAAILSLLAGRTLVSADTTPLGRDLDFLRVSLDWAVLESVGFNLLAVTLQSLPSGFDSRFRSKRAFEALLATAVPGSESGPLTDFVGNNLLFSLKSYFRFGVARARARDLGRAQTLARAQAQDVARDLALDRAGDLARALDRDLPRARARALDRARDRALQTTPSPDSANAFWRRLSSDPEVVAAILQFVCEVLDLAPAALWGEALRTVFLPTVPDRIRLVDPPWWKETREAFEAGKATEADVYAAAWQLIFDGLLYVVGYHKPDVDWLREDLDYRDDQIAEHQRAAAESQALFAELAGRTREHEDAPLRIAHCLRDLAYGDESRGADLTAMVESHDPAYREIFERCYWRPTEEERKREEKQQAKRSRR